MPRGPVWTESCYVFGECWTLDSLEYLRRSPGTQCRITGMNQEVAIWKLLGIWAQESFLLSCHWRVTMPRLCLVAVSLVGQIVVCPPVTLAFGGVLEVRQPDQGLSSYYEAGCSISTLQQSHTPPTHGHLKTFKNFLRSMIFGFFNQTIWSSCCKLEKLLLQLLLAMGNFVKWVYYLNVFLLR